MDIKELAASETFSVHLKHPVMGLLYDDGKPVTITIYGPDSEFVRDLKYKEINRRMDSSYKAASKAEEIFAEGNRIIGDRVVSVNGLSMGGKPVKPSDIESLLGDVSMGWLRDQIDKASMDRSLFFSGA